MYKKKFGEVSERLKEHAWKACIWKRIKGSNPFLTKKNISYKVDSKAISIISLKLDSLA